MADIASLKQKVTTLVDNVKYYWKEPRADICPLRKLVRMHSAV